MMSPFSNRLTMPFLTCPISSLYFAKMFSRSASRTFWKITCLAVWAAIRPRSSVGRGNSTSMSTSASSPYSVWASSSDISVAGLVTASTIFFTATSSICPDSVLNRARMFSFL